MRYNVSYEKNNVYQNCLVESDHNLQENKELIAQRLKVAAGSILGIKIATADDERPGKPVIWI